MDPNKAHCNDEISIRLLKLSATLISKLLQIFYRSCLDNECVPQTRKKANIVSIHKNVDKQLKKKLSTSLVPISSNIFEEIIFNLSFKHLDDNNLLSSNQ